MGQSLYILIPLIIIITVNIPIIALYLHMCFKVLFTSIIRVGLAKLSGWQFFWVRGVISWFNSSGETMIPLRILSGGIYGVVYLAVRTKILPIVVSGLWTGGCITGLANLDLTGFGVDCGRGGVFVSTLLGQIGNNGK